MTNALTLTLPIPTLAAIGLESNVSADVTGALAFTLPLPAILVAAESGCVANAALTLPVPALALAGDTGVPAVLGLKLPVPTLSLTGSTAAVANLAWTLPVPRLSLTGPNALVLSLPVPSLQVVGKTGVTGGLTFMLPVPMIDLEGEIPFTANLALGLPPPQIMLAGATGSAGRMAQYLTNLALALDGCTGVVGEITLKLPAFRLHLQGHGPYMGDVALTLPMLLLQATGTTSSVTPAQPDGAVNPAIVMHTETGALTQYTNYPFNSFAMFNGMYLAASAEGLFLIGGTEDNGAIINAAVRVGITDFGTSFLKRIDRSYVGYRTDGDLIIRVYTDEVDQRDYLLAATGRLGLHGNHFRIGKGLRARYWQFEVMNRNGANFTLNSIEVKPTQLRRRIGGGDA